MTNKHTVFIGLSALFLLGLLVYSIFRDYGYNHLSDVRLKLNNLIQANAQIGRENYKFRVEIERLKTDPVYIESIARHELGMVKKDELILKPRNAPHLMK
jgi:cell division protein FtsB